MGDESWRPIHLRSDGQLPRDGHGTRHGGLRLAFLSWRSCQVLAPSLFSSCGWLPLPPFLRRDRKSSNLFMARIPPRIRLMEKGWYSDGLLISVRHDHTDILFPCHYGSMNCHDHPDDDRFSWTAVVHPCFFPYVCHVDHY